MFTVNSPTTTSSVSNMLLATPLVDMIGLPSLLYFSSVLKVTFLITKNSSLSNEVSMSIPGVFLTLATTCGNKL